MALLTWREKGFFITKNYNNMKIAKETFTPQFTERIENIPKSFIREMLKTASSAETISFAGGLPDEALFPLEPLRDAFLQASQKYGNKLFQYASSEGFEPLKKWIANRYLKQFGLQVSPAEILITNGSQQAFDLLGKIFLRKNDQVLIEQPGYLGAIQSFMCFEPEILGIPLLKNGMNIDALRQALNLCNPKLMHIVPNFQNPSGIQYEEVNRKRLAAIISNHPMLLIEDDPYGELFYDDTRYMVPVKKYLGNQSILLGSFSKTLSPGMRLGWMVADEYIIEKLIVAKQASDLHTNSIAQAMVYEYLVNNDFEMHLNKIRSCYQQRRDEMTAAIRKYFPEGVRFEPPAGGMFIWIELPEHIQTRKLLRLSMDAGVLFVPGDVFYADRNGENTFRLNFTKSSSEDIEKGIKIIGKAIAFLNSKHKVYAVQ